MPVVLHRAERREGELAAVERQAEYLAACGGEVLIVAASNGREGYEEGEEELVQEFWEELFRGLASVDEIGDRHGLSVAVRPHFGTVIERRYHLERFLEGCETALCLDTGHLVLGGTIR